MNAGCHLGSRCDQSPLAESIFGREEETQRLRERLVSRRSFLLHGPAGVGKTLLLSVLLPELSQVLYSPQNSTPQALYWNLGEALIAGQDQSLRKKGVASLQNKTAIATKGLVRDALRDSGYLIVVDHLVRPSQAMAATIRELRVSCSVPVVAVSRSDHMEDAGFVLQSFSDRKERLALRNFDPEAAAQFATWCAGKESLQAENAAQFLEKIVEFSAGNPGAMLHMIRMARSSKYLHGGQIKIIPLYIDYKLATVADA